MNSSRKRKVTIRDVAEHVGVHHSTVSRALSPDKRDKISPAVVKKVEKAAKKLGYYPNIVASLLKKNRSFAVGVLIPDLMNPVFPPIIRGIQDTAESAGFTVVTTNTDDDAQKELDSLRSMQSRTIEGVILATARRQDRTVDRCIEEEVPFVLVNRTVDQEGVNAVVLDEEHGIRRLVDHLVGLGHRRIAHVGGPEHTSTGHHRAQAFKANLRIHGLDADLVEHANKFTIDEGKRVFNELYARDSEFTAVVAGNDLLALGCMDAMKEVGLSAPGDISVTGYDDILFINRMEPSLTTVAVPKYEMGAQAAKMLMEVLSGEQKEPVLLRMQPKLVVRGSTGRAPDKN